MGAWDYLGDLVKRRRDKNTTSQPVQTANAQAPAASSSQSSTISSRTVDYGDSGGGGMNMVSAFTDLGDKLHKNALSTMQVFSNIENERRDRRRQAEQDAEAKRQFNEQMTLQNRDRNLNALDLLATQRFGAQQIANRKPSFRDALAKTIV